MCKQVTAKYLFSIITVNYNNSLTLIDVLDKTLNSLGEANYEVIIVDNASNDGSAQKLKTYYKNHKNIRVLITTKNGGFGFGNNYGAAAASSKVLWFLNSDAWVSSAEGLNETLSLNALTDVGLIGTSVRIDGQEATPQGGSDMSFRYFLISSFRLGALFRSLPKPLRNFLKFGLRYVPGIIGSYVKSIEHQTLRTVTKTTGVGGASFLISKTQFQRLGAFDERFFLYDEDGDLCMRANKMGLKCFIQPKILVHTYPSATTSKVPSMKLKRIKRESRLLLINKHFSGYKRLILLFCTHLTWLLL